MKSVVITGSTKGLGLGLARAFLAKGCRVTIVGRNPERVEIAQQALAGEFGADGVLGCVAEMGSLVAAEVVWARAEEHFGKIDIWINNAATFTTYGDFTETPQEQIEDVVRTNIIGLMNGSRVALRGILARNLGGALYNVEGGGGEKRILTGAITYAATKSAVRYFTRALAVENKGRKVTIGLLEPGMVLTDALVRMTREMPPEDFARVRPFFNALTERVEIAAPKLVARVLANTKNGAHITLLSPATAMRKIAAIPFMKRDLFGGAAAPL